jgi:hypothetical protein
VISASADAFENRSAPISRDLAECAARVEEAQTEHCNAGEREERPPAHAEDGPASAPQ